MRCLAKTGLITFSGPHFSTFGCLHGVEYTIDYFQRCLFFNESVSIKPSETWSDDEWYLDQENRHFMLNPGLTAVQSGFGKGSIIGGNIDCLTVLQGTEYMPSLEDRILFLEDNYPITAEIFDRHLQSLILQKNFRKIKGIVIGRFQKASNISMDALKTIIESKSELKSIPVIAGADFGHTMPLFTFPIGGTVEIEASSSTTSFKILPCVR